MILGAGAVGYVLGARAGRERYEQIARQAKQLRDNPTVRQKVVEARHAAGHVAKDTAGTAADKIRRNTGSRGSATAPPSTRVPGVATNGFGRGDEGL